MKGIDNTVPIPRACQLKLLGIAVHTIDHFAEIPLWQYSMAFLYLKTYLKQFPEADSVAFDIKNYYQNESTDTIIADIVKSRPHAVLFSVYVWNYLIYRDLSRRIKEYDPDIVIILGGPEVAEQTRTLLSQNPTFDVIVRGEGEHTFYEIVKALLTTQDLAAIRGVTFRRGAEIVRTPNQDPSILNPLSVIPSVFSSDVFDWHSLRGSFVALETQRGCNFSCGFCRYRKIGEGARFFPLERVFADLKYISQLGCKYLYLMDPTFNNDLSRAKAILRHIIDLNMNVQINAEMIPELIDEELVELAIRAGLVNLEIGIQAVRKQVLTIMKRPRHQRKLEERTHIACIKEVDGKRLKVIPQIIYGLPGDTFDTYCESFDFIYDLDVAEIATYHLLILRDTQFFADREKYQMVYESDPPHRLVSNCTWPGDTLILAGKLSCAAMSTQYTLRKYIKRYCAKSGIPASAFFLSQVGVAEFPDVLACSFPIYTQEHADVQLQCLNRIEEVLMMGGIDHEVTTTVEQTRTLFEARLDAIRKKDPTWVQSELERLEAELLALEGIQLRETAKPF